MTIQLKYINLYFRRNRKIEFKYWNNANSGEIRHIKLNKKRKKNTKLRAQNT